MSNYFRFCNEQFDLINECTTNNVVPLGAVAGRCFAVIFQLLSKK